MLFVVFLLVVGGVAYAVLNNLDEQQLGKEGGGGRTGKGGAASSRGQGMKPGEIEVAVLNGTEAPGLAASWGNKLEGKGFEVGAVTNTNSTFENSVVMFAEGASPEAKAVAKRTASTKSSR